MAQENPSPTAHIDQARWFTPLVKLVRGIFVAQVRLERREGQLHIVLRDTKHDQRTPAAAGQAPAPPKTSSTSSSPPDAMGVDAQQLLRMQEALAQVLDQHAGARQVLKHLGYLEHKLRRKGASCFLELPIGVLKPALLQLDQATATQPASQGLTELRACLVVTVVDRDVGDTDDSGRLSEFNVGDKVQVRELSHTDFAMVDQSWPMEAEEAPS